MTETNKLQFSSNLMIGSLLFGLFFGAGNLIFPIHMGQLAGPFTTAAVVGFLITAIGLPFLGVVAMAITNSSSLFDLSSRVHPAYAYFMTIAYTEHRIDLKYFFLYPVIKFDLNFKKANKIRSP